MRPGPAWAAGLALSVLVHAAAAVILVPLYAPQDPPAQPPPETRLDMETVDAPQQDATAETPEAETAAEGEAQGTTLGAGAVPQSDARPVTAPAERMSGLAPTPTRPEAADPAGTPLAETAPAPGRLTAAAPGAEPLAAATPDTADLTAAPAPTAQSAALATPRPQSLASATPDTASLGAADPAAETAQAARPSAQRVAESELAGQSVRLATPAPARLAAAETPATQALAAALPAAAPVGAEAPETESAAVAAPPAESLAATQAPAETAPAATPNRDRLAATEAPLQALAAAPAPATSVTATEAEGATLVTAAPRAETARPAAAQAESLAAAAPAGTTAPAATPPAATLATLAPESTPGAPLAPAPEPAAAVTATPAALPAAEATGQPTATLAAQGTPLPQARADAAEAVEAAPPATAARAALAWQFGDRVVTDPQALATIQAFMEPAALDDAEGVKDDLSSVLTGVDCARLSATFIPETGTLEMRGHIPDPELQGPILAALQAQVGEGIPVTANLLHLPAPQCGALTGISQVGLPQSTDQFTDQRLIGETAHAREYSYTEGQRLQFDLTAPDYDAFVYVDYFNADGDVIHLVPNDIIPLEAHAAKSVFGVGKERPAQPGLRITIGPPFGQEIAVAFAASHRLYDGVRPIVEPAAPYLKELQALVAAARAQHDDFKGEWVYFFITTAPATQ